MRINGIPVVDAKKGVRLNITASDVKKGDNKDPAACAAAQACMRELDATEARVHIGRTYVHVGKQWVRYQTSDALRSEIVAFDRGGQFMPGEYVLGPCKQSLKLGSKRKPGNGKGKKNPKKRAYHITTNIRARGANR